LQFVPQAVHVFGAVPPNINPALHVSHLASPVTAHVAQLAPQAEQPLEVPDAVVLNLPSAQVLHLVASLTVSQVAQSA